MTLPAYRRAGVEMGAGGQLVVGAAQGYKPPAPVLKSYTLRWWSQIRVPRLHLELGSDRWTIQYDLCWAQTSLHGITESEVQFLQLLLGPAEGSRYHRQHSEPDNWLLQRLMAGVEGAVYGIHLQQDRPEQAAERQPQRTQARDANATQHYGGVVGTVLGPGVHPYDLGI